jgi:PLP dependent protein
MECNMTTISMRLQDVRDKLHEAEVDAGRPTGSVKLLAVSKAHDTASIIAAYQAGQRAFGENYLQECLGKQTSLKDYAIEWHFIGPIQSNKTQAIAQHFDWVHSVDRVKIAERLNQSRANLPPLNVCLQVNISGEDSKSGVSETDIAPLAETVSHLPNLKLRGLMTIPEPNKDAAFRRIQFEKMRHIFENLKAEYGLDTLSMGMSEDYTEAILEGATIVRIGSAIFGARRYNNTIQPS